MKTKIIFIILCFLSLNVMGQGIITRESTRRTKPNKTQSAKTKTSRKPKSGTLNGHEWVDLGLSVKWATCNVGASSPSDYGGYYAWGETSTKNDYSWSTLNYYISGDNYVNVKFSKYVTESIYGSVDNKTRLEMSDDAARQNWGGTWRMPTKAEFQELIGKCTWTWTTQDGHNGYKVVSKMNGNSIFLPAAGFCDGTGLKCADAVGYYWSSSRESYSYSARHLYLASNAFCTYNDSRCLGQSLRPVLR